MKAIHWFKLTLRKSSLLQNSKFKACVLWIPHLHLPLCLKLHGFTNGNSEKNWWRFTYGLRPRAQHHCPGRCLEVLVLDDGAGSECLAHIVSVLMTSAFCLSWQKGLELQLLPVFQKLSIISGIHFIIARLSSACFYLLLHLINLLKTNLEERER